MVREKVRGYLGSFQEVDKRECVCGTTRKTWISRTAVRAVEQKKQNPGTGGFTVCTLRRHSPTRTDPQMRRVGGCMEGSGRRWGEEGIMRLLKNSYSPPKSNPSYSIKSTTGAIRGKCAAGLARIR